MESSPLAALGKTSDSFPQRAILTVVTRSHLKFALTLARSSLVQEPLCRFYVAVIDCLSKFELEENLLNSNERPAGIFWLSLEELHLPD